MHNSKHLQLVQQLDHPSPGLRDLAETHHLAVALDDVLEAVAVALEEEMVLWAFTWDFLSDVVFYNLGEARETLEVEEG